MFFIKPVYANCPVCVITIGGGMILAKKLGIDDLLVAIWISGVNTAIAFWIAKTFTKPILRSSLVWSLFFYFTSFWYFDFTKQLHHKTNVFLGQDKIIFGMTLGLIVYFISYFFDRFLRGKNNGKVFFSYQKVIIPFIFLLVITLIFKLLI